MEMARRSWSPVRRGAGRLDSLPYFGVGNPLPVGLTSQDIWQSGEMDARAFLLNFEERVAARAGHLVDRTGAMHDGQRRGIAYRAVRLVGPFIWK